jgi:hypothetical protein
MPQCHRKPAQERRGEEFLLCSSVLFNPGVPDPVLEQTPRLQIPSEMLASAQMHRCTSSPWTLFLDPSERRQSKAHGGDKIVRNDFEQLKAGSKRASSKDGASNKRSVQSEYRVLRAGA